MIYFRRLRMMRTFTALHFISDCIRCNTFNFHFYAKLMEAVLKIASLNVFNKIAGAVLGILKFALAVSVIFWLLKPLEGSWNPIPEKSRKESVLYPYVLKAASALAPAVKDVKDEFRENLGSGSLIGE